MALGLIQAVIVANHARIDEIAANGRHPLEILERVIELRGNHIDTLMMHVPRDCAISAGAVTRVIRYLEDYGRHDHAVAVLKNWRNCR